MVEVSSFLLIIVGLSMIGGIIFGLYYTKIVSVIFDLKKRRNPSTNSTTREQEKVKEELENKLKMKPDLIKKNSELIEDELKIYQFEKDLATHAIEKILLASKNKAIDSFEKDRLLLKYKDQLKNLNGKMEKIQSEIDVTRLINLRNDLAFLLDNKISDIDEKIKDINLKIGTNYNLKDILNHTRKNKSYDDSLKNINNPSFIDIEGKGGGSDDNLNFRELTNYKNDPTQKIKEMVIESERKKIDDLKDQVLVALNRLDKTGDIKMELKDDVDTKIVTETKTTFMDKDFQDNEQKKEESNENKEYVSIENNKKPTNTVSENKLNFPTIFSSLGKSNNDIVTTKEVTFDPLSKSTAGTLKNYVNSNSNTTINESNSFTYLDTEKKNNDNDNKKTPLSNILNQVNPNFDHSMMKFKYDKKYLSKDQSHKDKPSYLDHNANNNTNNNRFKFPLAFIFSKNGKEEEEEEEEENKKVEKRNYDTNEERKDPLSNIVNKSNRK
jgi:hypothetical protein